MGSGRRQCSAREKARAAYQELMERDEAELLDHERAKVKAILQNLILRELLAKARSDDRTAASNLLSRNLFE